MSKIEDVIADRQDIIRAIDQKAAFLVAAVAIFLQTDSNPTIFTCCQQHLSLISFWAGGLSLLVGFYVTWPRGISALAKRDELGTKDVSNLNQIMKVKNGALVVSLVLAVIMVVAWGV